MESIVIHTWAQGGFQPGSHPYLEKFLAPEQKFFENFEILKCSGHRETSKNDIKKISLTPPQNFQTPYPAPSPKPLPLENFASPCMMTYFYSVFIEAFLTCDLIDRGKAASCP